jgi:hypothetical protein
VLTEFGGIAFTRANDTDSTWGYSRADSAVAFLDHYRRMLEVANTTHLFSGFCYTQFTDTFQEANGLLNADRSPKIPLAQINAATRNIKPDN